MWCWNRGPTVFLPTISKTIFNFSSCTDRKLPCSYYFIGAMFNQFLTDVGKYTFGRPRPNFLDVCQPSVQCTSDNLHVYIAPEVFNCTRTSHPLIEDGKLQHTQMSSRLAMPSGHASYVFFFALYLTAYLELRLRWSALRASRHFIQIGSLAFAVWVSATRVIDHKHRYSDIAAGALLGAIVAIFTLIGYDSSRGKSSEWGRSGEKRSISSLKLTPPRERSYQSEEEEEEEEHDQS